MVPTSYHLYSATSCRDCAFAVYNERPLGARRMTRLTP